MLKEKLKKWMVERPYIWLPYSKAKLFAVNLLMLRYHLYDMRNTFKYMYWPVTDGGDFDILKAELLFQFHKLEKGLIMPGKRRIFGESIVVRVLDILSTWHDRNYVLDDSVYLGALGTLKSYKNRIAEDGFLEESAVVDKITVFLNGLNVEESDFIETPIKLENKFEGGFEEYMSLVKFRRSVREFSSENVDKNLLLNAIKAAQMSPSVCNRQASKIHFFSDRTKIDALLKYQNGNSGFGHLIPCLGVVTVDQKAFFNASERNEPFIDGGLFTMSFLYGLSSQGLTSCCLNWCVSPSVDKQIHLSADIPESERVMMFVAIGYPVDGVMVPASARKNTSQAIIFKD